MRGAQKAQPFGHPLDGRVRRHSFIALPRQRVAKDTKLILAFWLRNRAALHFTSGSVPEQNPVRHRLGERRVAPCALAGKWPAAGPAATTGLTPWRITVPTVEQPAAVVVLWSAGSPEQDSEVAGDVLAEITATSLSASEVFADTTLLIPKREYGA